MAFQQKNEQTVRVQFAGGFEGRNSNTAKDKRYVNMYVEKFGTEESHTLKVVKRPGIVQDHETAQGTIRGCFGWINEVWTVVDDVLYQGVADVLTLTTTTGQIGFTACTTSGASTMFFCDGVKGYVIDTDGIITEITDVDFPTPHVPTPVFIDGYVCIPRYDSADIYNCDLDDPLSWTASNFITSELFPDNLVSLARQNNQIVAFGSTGTEFFYDAANPTGTPFAKNSGAFLQIGSCSPYCIGQNERYCFFIGQSQSGGRSVWKLDGFSPEQVSTDSIDRILDAEGADIVDATGYLIRLAGHFFFVICLQARTFVYDIDLKVWHEWSTSKSIAYATGGAAINTSSIDDIAINGSAGDSSVTTVVTDEPFVWRNAADKGDGKVYLVHSQTGIVAHFDTFTYTDLGVTMKCAINTAIIDFGSTARKFIHRMSVVSDLATNTLYVKWSDDDYQTWSKLHQINMSSRPVLHRLGATRRRAFNLYYTDNQPFRIEALEFITSKGET